MISKTLAPFFVAVSLFSSLSFSETAYQAPKRILIYYATIGNGHESSAKAIKAGILARDPSVEVVLQDVRQFSGNRLLSWFNAKAYGLMVKYKPEMWDAMYNKQMQAAYAANSVTDFSKPYDENLILENIKEVKPDMIINTFNIGVDSLILLKEKGLLPANIKIAWMHTDYVVERYHQLLSRDIDMTFLAHEEMEKAWIKAGIPESKVMTTGMSVNPAIYDVLTPENRTKFMSEVGLDSSKKTIVLMSGKEGVGNFPKIVTSIASNISEPIQIVAVCGLNQRHQKALAKLKLPPNVSLKIEGFIPNEKVLNYVKSSDLYITKSGGLSTSEAFVIGKPLVLLDINGGQERYNSKFFNEQGLASIAANESESGHLVKDLLYDDLAKYKMVAQQMKFREKINLGAITDYVFTGTKPAYLTVSNSEHSPVMAGYGNYSGSRCLSLYGAK